MQPLLSHRNNTTEHEANTERLILKNTSMRHVEGGWPKDVDFTEQSDVNRFRKKAEKDDDYKVCIYPHTCIYSIYSINCVLQLICAVPATLAAAYTH
jgi:hypothetical protein